MKYISLFSGIEAATVAWKPLGWEAEAHAKPSASPDSGRLWTTHAASSCSNISELAMRLIRNGSCGKTSPAYYPQMADALSAHCSHAWPNPGLMGGRHGECWTLSSSEWPSDADVCSLSSTLETGDVPRRYYLSARACAGIIRRAKKRGKPLPDDLLQALERQLAALTSTQATEDSDSRKTQA